MAKDKIVLVDENFDGPKKRKFMSGNVMKLIKLLFGSYGIILFAISVMALSVLNGDVFSSFTNGAFTNLNDLLTAVGGNFAYPIAMIISGIILLGPLHYYAVGNYINILIIIIIVFLFTGFIIGRMFRHPGWAFIAGIVIMLSFCSIVLILLNTIDYIVQSAFNISFPVSGIIYGIIEGLFGMDTTSLMVYSTLENGALLGLCGALWGAIFMEKSARGDLDVEMKCDDNKICKIR